MAEDDVVLLPRFFKVFLSETSTESFAIPSTFMEHLHDSLPRKAKLQGTGGRVWTVSWKKIREQAYFTDGWSKFVEDHELKNGEFLTFVYDGHRTFEVSLYNRLGCKEIRAVAEVVELDEGGEEGEALMDDEDDESIHSIHVLDDDEIESDAAGNSNLEDIANPCFVYEQMKRKNMLVPAMVVKTHKLKFGESIKFVDENGSFVSGRAKYKGDKICFKGWDKVCIGNKIKEGDTVKCELLHTRKVVHSIKIHITRGEAA